MPVDPSIALQVKPVEIADPLKMYAQAQFLKNSQVQNETAQLQQQQLRTTMATQQRTKDFLGTPTNYGPADPNTGARMLLPEKMPDLYAIDPEAAKDYQKTRTDELLRSTQIRKEQSQEAAEKWKLQKEKDDMITQEMTGGLQVFLNTIKQNGGDVNNPEKNPTAYAAATAAVEALRPGIRAKLIKAGAMDPNTPEEPFDYKKWTQAVFSKEKPADILKAQLEHQLQGRKLVENANGFVDVVDTNTGDVIHTTTPWKKTYGPLVAAQDPETKQPIFASQDANTGEIITHREVNPDPNKGKSQAYSAAHVAMRIDNSEARYSMDKLEKLFANGAGASHRFGKNLDKESIIGSWLDKKFIPNDWQNVDAVANRLVAAISSAGTGGRAAISNERIKSVVQMIPMWNDPAPVRQYKIEQLRNMIAIQEEAIRAEEEKAGIAPSGGPREENKAAPAAGAAGASPAGATQSGPTKKIRIADPRSKTGYREMDVPVAQPQQQAAPAAAPAAPAGGDEFPQEMLQHLPKDGRAMKFNVDGQIQTWRIENGKPVRKE